MYGGVAKTPAMVAADERFVQEATRIAGSREAAALLSIRRGYDALGRRDTPAAMRGFNQAWLLDPANCSVYQGMAITTLEARRNPADSAALFERATAAPKLNWSCFVDRVRFLNTFGRFADALDVVASARVAPIERTPESIVRLDVLETLAEFQLGRFAAACPKGRRLAGVAPPDLLPDLALVAASPACRDRPT